MSTAPHGPTIRRRYIVLLLALLFAVTAAAGSTSTAWAGMEDEAERQLGFARAELTQGQYARAIASAESALRLNPAAYEAFLVKALAYEQLGELELASSLLVAYQEITKGLDRDPRAEEALARVRAAGPRGSRRTPRSRAGRAGLQIEQVEPTGSVDVQSYKERVGQAIQAGRCAVAMATASELTTRSPGEPSGHKLVGDAARCAGEIRPAVLAYERYQERGGDDPRVGLMLRGLVENLAVVQVVVERQEGGPVPRVQLTLPDGDRVASVREPGGSLTFAHLPTGVALTLQVAGRGLEPMEVEIEPLLPKETRPLEVHPVYVGLGTVHIADHDASLCRTTLVTADGEAEVGAGGSEQVTAGQLTALVSSEHGEVGVPLVVPPNGRVDFDPKPWIPTSLTVVDLPTGTEIRVFVDGFGDARVEVTETVPLFGGRIDTQTGVRLADPLQVRSLIGGSGGIFVSHPLLGEGAGSVVLEPGGVNATTFDWRGMDGVARVSGPYLRWSEGRADLQRAIRGQTVAPAVIAVGSAIASGLLLGLAIDADVRLARTAEAHQVDLNHVALEQRSAFAITGGITATTAVIGVVISAGVGATGKRRLADLGEWDPIEAQPVQQ